jgi:hypothetical protein
MEEKKKKKTDRIQSLDHEICWETNWVGIVRCQIPNHVAVKISSELKMLLIDNSLLDV